APVPALRRALAIIEDSRLPNVTYVERRRARVRALLAIATRDRGLAAKAAAWYRAAGNYDAVVNQLAF
ncbi:MAG TPA: hypothetical protein VGC41_06210, partial [Kofleriaceae bacterium]